MGARTECPQCDSEYTVRLRRIQEPLFDGWYAECLQCDIVWTFPLELERG